MRRWNDSGRVPVPSDRHIAAMRLTKEQFSPMVTGSARARGSRDGIWRPGAAKKIDSKNPSTNDAAISALPARAVMLHLRARYDSKAAILTIPAPLTPVENRSPA